METCNAAEILGAEDECTAKATTERTVRAEDEGPTYATGTYPLCSRHAAKWDRVMTNQTETALRSEIRRTLGALAVDSAGQDTVWCEVRGKTAKVSDEQYSWWQDAASLLAALAKIPTGRYDPTGPNYLDDEDAYAHAYEEWCFATADDPTLS